MHFFLKGILFKDAIGFEFMTNRFGTYIPTHYARLLDNIFEVKQLYKIALYFISLFISMKYENT